MSNSPAFRTWFKRFSGTDPLTHTTCRVGAQTIGPMNYGEEFHRRTTMTGSEAAILWDKLLARAGSTNPVQVDLSHADKVRAYRGRMRANGYGCGIHPITRINWVGIHAYAGRYGYHYAPLYDVHYQDGLIVRYAPLSWQAEAYGGITDEFYSRLMAQPTQLRERT